MISPIPVEFKDTASPIPGIPPPPDPFEGLYTLSFIERGTHVSLKHFRMKGEMKEIIAKCKNYCELQRYRFLRVHPFITDLAEDLRRNANLENQGF
jgi:hypothetical protein